MPAGVAQFFTEVRVKVSVESRRPLADSGEKDVVGTGMEVSGPDGVLAEYRLVGDHLYYRADLEAVGGAMGFPLPSADEIPEREKALEPLLAGKWVEVDSRERERAAADASGTDEDAEDSRRVRGGKESKGAPSGDADDADEADEADEIDSRTRQKIFKAVRSVIAREVTFSEKEEGADGIERIVAKASFRDLLTGVLGKLRPLAGGLPAGAALPTDEDLKEAPDNKVAVDFSLKNGHLTRVSVDLATLADDAKGAELPLVITFGEAGDISVPSGATKMPAGELGGPVNPFTTGLLGGF